MKFIKLFLVALFAIEVSCMAAIPSVGVFPASFPRDPVDVNVYLEHVLLGQVLQPLVESSPEGSLQPGAASAWKFSSDGLELRFIFDGKSKFSNGQSVRAIDAKYSLQRHKESPNSQSKSYLARIASMEVVGDNELVIRLSVPYVAMLKALSRDHLGIVPNGWKFSADSEEPFTGSGAYRAVKEKGEWFLRANPHFRLASSVKIPTWQVVLQTKDGVQVLPDLVPFAYEESIEDFKTNPKWKEGGYLEEPVTHFFQSSAWWYPHGKTYGDADRRMLAMCAVSELLARRAHATGLTRATGLIPAGIPGHLTTSPNVDCGTKVQSTVKNRRFHLAVVSRELKVLQDAGDIEAVEKQFDVKFDFSPVDGPDVPKLKERKPDVFLFAFAGGFQDPEGFLTVITALLHSELGEIFQSDYAAYQAASSQSDWEKRSPLYREIGTHLIENLRMVPGWRLKAGRVRCNNILLRTKDDLRYTPKLIDYELRKEDA